MNPADAKMLTRFPGLDFGLGETLDMLRETVQSFAAGEIAPRAAEIDRNNEFPMDLWRKLGDLGLLGVTVEEEYGGAGDGLSRPHRRHGGDQPGLGRGGPFLRRAFQPVREPDPPQRQRSPEAQVSAQADLGRARGRARDERAQLGFGRREHEAARRQEGRALRAQRQQDVDHQRARRRHAGGLREDRRQRRAQAASPLSSSRRASRDSPPRRSSTSSACADPTPANWCSRIAKCRRRTCSARSTGRATC